MCRTMNWKLITFISVMRKYIISSPSCFFFLCHLHAIVTSFLNFLDFSLCSLQAWCVRRGSRSFSPSLGHSPPLAWWQWQLGLITGSTLGLWSATAQPMWHRMTHTTRTRKTLEPSHTQGFGGSAALRVRGSSVSGICGLYDWRGFSGYFGLARMFFFKDPSSISNPGN